MLLETIKIIQGQPQFLAFHNDRLNASRKALFQCTELIDLEHVIQAPTKTETYRCRVVYAREIEYIEYNLYHETRTWTSFKIVEVSPHLYPFKYVNREAINQLIQLKGHAEDILMTHHGQVMDTSIANIAFFDGTRWITPAFPLLGGTTRERLLREKKIFAHPILVEELANFSQVALMNALLGFYPIGTVKWI